MTKLQNNKVNIGITCKNRSKSAFKVYGGIVLLKSVGIEDKIELNIYFQTTSQFLLDM